MSVPRICWDHSTIQYATQVDIGGLEVNDTYADAVFRAVHVSLPVLRMRNVSSSTPLTSSATEEDVYNAFTGELTSNEPLLLFITGSKGTGKSHLVRWLKSKIGNPPSWHIVYIEKRNTSLRKVIERILDGIDTESADRLREKLEVASSVITTESEAMDALVARVNHLVKHDQALEIPGLPGLSPVELADVRATTDRLLGDYTFRKALCQEEGPVARIVRLARGGTDPTQSIDEAELHLRESDFMVEPSLFVDTGTHFQQLIDSLRANEGFRSEVAALCDHYLPLAKTEIFTGQTTDLLDVFQDVRRELARRGQELCLYIEDLVLLHGIDKQLAQALTVPADRELCRLRAAIAVTSGYLLSIDTFTDRGIHFTLDIEVDSVESASIQDFVARYLNVGRLTRQQLVELDSNSSVPNACHDCRIVADCHEIFGASPSNFGFFPFNGSAVERLVSLASAGRFQPREILREVIRLPLDAAEAELPQRGQFPSALFAKSLDENRRNVPSDVRARIRQDNPDGSEQEISLRAFYATSPPSLDPALDAIARFLAVQLTEGIETSPSDESFTPLTQPPSATRDDVESWVNGDSYLSGANANKVRRYVCEATIDFMRLGSFGLSIRSPRNGEWRVGTHTLRLADVEIERSQGGGTNRGELQFRIGRTVEEAILIRGILAAQDGGGRLDLMDRGRWALHLNTRIASFAAEISAESSSKSREIADAVQILTLLRQANPEPGSDPTSALPLLLLPRAADDCSQALREFMNATRGVRDEALTLIRDQATAAKGRGKPSVLDVAQLRPLIQRSLGQLDLANEKDSTAPSPLMEAIISKQTQASRALGAQVSAPLGRLSTLLDPEDDLAAAAAPIDKLVRDAHINGLLPHADTLTRYELARDGLDQSAIALYPQLRAAAERGMPSSALWLGRKDVVSILAGLEEYVAVVTQVMNHLEAAAGQSQVNYEETDAVRVIAALRSLADQLDVILNEGN